jgi:hypothetical protein
MDGNCQSLTKLPSSNPIPHIFPFVFYTAFMDSNPVGHGSQFDENPEETNVVAVVFLFLLIKLSVRLLRRRHDITDSD